MAKTLMLHSCKLCFPISRLEKLICTALAALGVPPQMAVWVSRKSVYTRSENPTYMNHTLQERILTPSVKSSSLESLGSLFMISFKLYINLSSNIADRLFTAINYKKERKEPISFQYTITVFSSLGPNHLGWRRWEKMTCLEKEVIKLLCYLKDIS